MQLNVETNQKPVSLPVGSFGELFWLIYIHIYQPLRSGRIWHKVNFFKRSLKGLKSEFSFS